MRYGSFELMAPLPPDSQFRFGACVARASFAAAIGICEAAPMAPNSPSRKSRAITQAISSAIAYSFCSFAIVEDSSIDVQGHEPPGADQIGIGAVVLRPCHVFRDVLRCPAIAGQLRVFLEMLFVAIVSRRAGARMRSIRQSDHCVDEQARNCCV